jgi:HPt (histidine-containing phosphotransfer) domain-containing protein
MEIIDWAEAMNQVGGDRDFLDEVLRDLLTESDEAETEMEAAIKADDFACIKRAAHRIKGSAAYLCCNALRDISLKLQDLGHEGEKKPSDSLMEDIRKDFESFRTCLQELKEEIHKRK